MYQQVINIWKTNYKLHTIYEHIVGIYLWFSVFPIRLGNKSNEVSWKISNVNLVACYLSWLNAANICQPSSLFLS